MSTKKRYSLSVLVATMAELVNGAEKTYVDISVYAIQTAMPTQFTHLNHTMCGLSKTGSFSDSTSSFILFSFHDPEDTEVLRLPVYNAVCNLIGTTNGKKSMCICIPTIKDPVSSSLSRRADMILFVEGVVAGLRDAMKDCTAVVKTNRHSICFVVPEEMKESLTLALEKIE